jgi:hypothetical protein
MATTPPVGYFDASAQTSAPPAGYFDASKAAQPAATPQLSDYMKTDDTGIVAGVRRGIQGLVGLPGQVYHAFKDPGTPEEAQAMEKYKEPIFGSRTIETGLHRLVEGPLEQEYATGQEMKKQGRLADYLGHTAMSYLPLIGPMAGQAVTRSEAGDTSGAVAELVTLGLAGKAAGKVGEIPEAARPALQKYWNVGPELTKDAVEKQAAQTGEITNKYQAKAAQVQQANDAAKQTYMDRGQLLNEAQGHAQELADHLPQLAEQERAVAKSLYPDIDGTADAGELHDKLQDTIDAKLQGSEKPPVLLARMLKELEPEDPLAQASVFRGKPSAGATPLDDLPPTARARILQSMSEGERTAYGGGATQGLGELDFNRLHGYFSELGRELGTKDLPGDERAALTSARSAVETQMRDLAEDDGKFSRFAEAQKNWKQYENTFNKSWSDPRGVASPIARALQAKNPATGQLIPERVAQILSEPKSYKLAQQLLGKYGSAKTDVLQLMKEKLDQSATMPKTLKESPLPTAPNMPAPVDPQALKVAALKKSAQGLRSMQGIRGSLDVISLVHALMGYPKALLYPVLRRALSHSIESPRVMNYLTKPSEEEIQMIHPSKVYASKSSIPKVSAKAAAIAALASNQENRR